MFATFFEYETPKVVTVQVSIYDISTIKSEKNLSSYIFLECSPGDLATTSPSSGCLIHCDLPTMVCQRLPRVC